MAAASSSMATLQLHPATLVCANGLHCRKKVSLYSGRKPNNHKRRSLLCVISPPSPPPPPPPPPALNVLGFERAVPNDADKSRLQFEILRDAIKKKDLRRGEMVHANLVKSGMDSATHFCNCLLSFYSKLHSDVHDAARVFQNMDDNSRDVVSWTAMISAYANRGRVSEAMQCFVRMQEQGIFPNEFTFTTVVGVLDLHQGRQIHARILKSSSFQKHLHVGNVLIDMYFKFGALRDARQVFAKMPRHDCVSWNTLIAGLVGAGHTREALDMFVDMRLSGIKADGYSLSSALAGVSRLEEGLQIHALAIKSGLASSLVVCNSLINMYGYCNTVKFSFRVFSHMEATDETSWTSMIAACSRNGKVHDAFELLQQSPKRSLVLCNAMVNGFAQNNEDDKACHLFKKMLQAGMKVDHFTLSTVLSSCLDLSTGRQLHAYVVKSGLEESLCVGTALLDLYAKMSSVGDAEGMFESMPCHNQVSLTAMISAYARNGLGQEALLLFRYLQSELGNVDTYAVSAVASACGTMGDISQARQLHAYVLRHGFGLDIGVYNSLICMYNRCCSVEDSSRVFETMGHKDVYTWNAMILGFAQHGFGKKALQFFHQMLKEGRAKPDGTTFLGVLSACKCVGSVTEGFTYFNSMRHDYGIIPWSSHYSSMVEIYGRVGCIAEAEIFVDSMPCEPDIRVWQALFHAARASFNIRIAKRAAENILSVQPRDPAMYVLHANIYASVGWWDEASKLRRAMKVKGFKKLPVRSWMFCNKQLHCFLFRNQEHPQINEIHAMLHNLLFKIKQAGHTPNTSFVSHNVEPCYKEEFLADHTAKVVVAFGLLNALPGKPIRVFKSVTICGDCHEFIKYVSRIEKCEVILRDATCVHHFKNGHCSCGDYW